MRILVISDTHIPIAEKDIPEIIEKEAKESNCCLHAGDLVSYEVFKKLSSWTKVYAVYGNMDNSETRKQLSSKLVFQLEDFWIGLVHGRGAPTSLIDYIHKEFLTELEKINLFVFGHSHCPFNKEINKKIYFNPGSPTDKVFSPYRSYGILEIDKNKIERRIIRIE